ncbi:enoyl-ACP reductase FabI [Microvirga sesbaniae]|uniref:enoyl-ACP reductase FabI n=1 Tax=Microvirga sesbaniae TaxID=681392 RepID=UPI0021C7B781|nr:enoyl-ACP reductase FabI [Microvirga sp. HBU67692]
MMPNLGRILEGKVGLVVGIANDQSIAAGCAYAFQAAGASLAVTYLNEKARPYVEPVAKSVDAAIFEPLDVETDEQLEALFSTIEARWRRLDFLLHSIAYCPKADLQGRVTDCSREGFAQAMDISVHSLIRLTRRAEPLMSAGGSILTMSYYGAEKVVDHYNIMGPVKSALEATVRYLAAELGPKGIRVNALSPGPLRTRAASGISHFDEIINEAQARAPEHRLVTIEEVGAIAACLASDASQSMTGNTAHVDAGYHIMA